MQNQAREPYAPYRFTVDEYYRMAETNILEEDSRVELLDGQVLVKEPSGPLHAGHGDILMAMFVRMLGDRAIVRAEKAFHIDDLNEPEPDLAIVQPREDRYLLSHPKPEEAFLLVEIAWSSATGDRRIKLPLYARAGIPEFWLIDLRREKLEVYRNPSDDGYRDFRVLDREDVVSPTAFPEISIRVGDIVHPLT